MNKQGNTYTIIYTSVMVIAVAFILAFAAIGLKPAQERNIAIDKPCPYSSTPTITSLPNTLSLFPVAGYGDPFGDTYR